MYYSKGRQILIICVDRDAQMGIYNMNSFIPVSLNLSKSLCGSRSVSKASVLFCTIALSCSK